MMKERGLMATQVHNMDHWVLGLCFVPGNDGIYLLVSNARRDSGSGFESGPYFLGCSR
jgi:hypothetical protein